MTAVLVASMLAAGCQPPPASEPPTDQPSGAAPSSQVAAPSATPGATQGSSTAVATSESLIAAALASGAITDEQSLLYRALALYDSPGLPDEFRSPIPQMDAATDLFGEVEEREATLSPELLTQLAPYRVRPADPDSIFNQRPAAASPGVSLAAVTAATAWQSQAVAGTGARVWVKASADSGPPLAGYASAVAKVWAKFPGVFTYPEPDKSGVPAASVNPDDSVDVYFVGVGDLDPRRPACVRNAALADCAFSAANHGYAQRADAFHGVASSGYLVIDAARSGDQLLDTLAHELAHAGQFAYDRHETSWLMESTATWVAYRVVKELELAPEYAYAHLAQFFSDLDQPLTRLSDSNAYASWLYFLFASMEEGDAVVSTMWTQAAANGPQGEKAVDKAFAFDRHFADFAVRNWNQDPVERQYKDEDSTFPTSHRPEIEDGHQVLEGGDTHTLAATLPALSSLYYSLEFEDDTRDVTFENTLSALPHAHVWAIKRIDGDWQKPEDWTKQSKREYCRDIPEEDLTDLILIVSNSSMTDELKASDPARVVAGTKGCAGWRGTMTATSRWDVGDFNGKATATFTGVWEPVPPDRSVVPCESPGPNSCIAYVPRGTISWTWDAHQNACDETRSGDVLAGAANDPRNAGGANGVPLSTQVFVLQPDGAGHYGYWGLGAWALPAPMACSNALSSARHPPAYFELSEESAGNGTPDGGGNTCSNTTWRIDTTADTIIGSCFASNNSGSSLKLEWNLTRIGGVPGR